MAVAKSLPPVASFFMQICPLCGTSQRMMIRGLYIDPDTKQGKLYPDMGYSFCNCRNIFFTKWVNITSDDENFNTCKQPVAALKQAYHKCEFGGAIKITLRDPYFIIWNRPHEYSGFDPRKNFILWDTESFIDECKKVGFELVNWYRDMDVESKTPEHSHVTLRKP